MRTLYLDLFSGISGDMFIGALLDLGLDAHRLEQELVKLHLDGYHVHVTRSQKGSIAGTKFDVHLESDHDRHDDGHGHSHHAHDSHVHSHEHVQSHSHSHSHSDSPSHDHEHSRTFAEIKQLIIQSSLSNWVKE